MEAEKKPQNRAKNGQFTPGNRANPGGRPKKNPEAMEILRAAVPEAAKKLVALLGSKTEKISLQAAQTILDRVWGKPVQASEVNMDVSGGLDLTAQIHAALLRREEERRNAGGG